MATIAPTVTSLRYPKRKREQISYYDSSSDENEGGDEYGAWDGNLTVTTGKKPKANHTHVSTKPLPKCKIFPFMSLPAELKNQIYALALTDLDAIFLIPKTKHFRRTVQRSVHHINSVTGYHCSARSQCSVRGSPKAATETPLPALTPNILLLNRAIYAETQPILYADNTFELEDTTAMHAFLAIIGPKNRATLTDLTIKGWGYTKAHKALNHPAFTMLASAVNLTRLHLDCQIAWGGPDKVAKQLYRDGFHWLEAVGAAKGKFDAAIELIDIPDERLGNSYSYSRRHAADLVPEGMLGTFRAELRKLLH